MKFKLEQTIYYLKDNRLHSADVLTRMTVENKHDDWAHTKEQKGIFQHFGESCVKYVTCHGVVGESEAFGTKDELMKSVTAKTGE